MLQCPRTSSSMRSALACSKGREVSPWTVSYCTTPVLRCFRSRSMRNATRRWGSLRPWASVLRSRTRQVRVSSRPCRLSLVRCSVARTSGRSQSRAARSASRLSRLDVPPLARARAHGGTHPHLAQSLGNRVAHRTDLVPAAVVRAWSARNGLSSQTFRRFPYRNQYDNDHRHGLMQPMGTKNGPDDIVDTSPKYCKHCGHRAARHRAGTALGDRYRAAEVRLPDVRARHHLPGCAPSHVAQLPPSNPAHRCGRIRSLLRRCAMKGTLGSHFHASQ